MLLMLIVNFASLSESDFQTKITLIIGALTGNSNFPEPWPEGTTNLAQLSAAFKIYQDAYIASQSGDKLKIAERNHARQAVVELVQHIALYLQLVAKGNADILATTGFDLRHEPVKGAYAGTLPAPTDVRVVHGSQSGTLDLHAAKLPGARAYEVDLAQGDPSQEANWHRATAVTSAQHILLDGLTPGQIYWLRLRGLGADGSGLWSAPVSIMVV